MKKIILCIAWVFCAVVTSAQNTGIGTTTPVARLHVTDSNVVFTGPPTIDFNTPYRPPVQGAGSRMMWYPQKAAFRAGAVDGTQWDKDSIGRYSFAVGFNSKAKGEGSFAAGSSTASQEHSTAMGFSTASGFYSTAMGGSIASGFYSTAMGNSDASGLNSTAMGFSTASGLYSTAMGVSMASVQRSTAMGQSNASGGWSTAAGFSTAPGEYAFAGGSSHALAFGSTALGFESYAKAYGGVALGTFNDLDDNPNPNVPLPQDRLFQIGNGDGIVRVNALTVLRNANMGIGNVNPSYPLSFSNSVGDKISLYGGVGAHYGFGIQGSLLQIHAALQSTDVAIGYGSSGAFTENFRVKGNGNVSLGMSTADATLTFGQSLSKKIILFHGGSGGEAGFGVFPNEVRIQSDYSGAAVTFGYDNAGTSFRENMRIEGNGNLQVRGSVFANSAFYTSDSRYKKGISAISNGLDKILLLNGYHYYWKDESQDSILQTGLMAQEVQKVFPELVREDNRGYLSVNYVGLIPYLIESIKELKKENEELRKMKMEWAEMKVKMEKLLSK